MIYFALLFAGIAVSDFLQGQSRRSRAVAAGSAALAVALLGATPAWLAVGGLLVVGGLGWLWAQTNDDVVGARRQLWGAALVLGLVGVMAISVSVSVREQWPSGWPAAQGKLGEVGPVRTMLLICVALLLCATANRLVRLALTVTKLEIPKTRMGEAGRIIGPIERILIFGSLLAGIGSAAALIVAAKSAIRFSEIRYGEGTDPLAEYILVGSLSSWGIALGLTGLSVWI
jgi:hypothetical protein